ncbi:MAG: Uma2 family endonuclease [Acidobacteriota bacterium]
MVATQAALAKAPVKTIVERCVLLRHVSWGTYESLLADYEDQAGPRFCYDNGVLEIKMPSVIHEKANRTLAQLVDVLAEEMNIDLDRLGSTTFKRKDLLKGFEPDSCFYIQNAGAIFGKDKLDLKTDPPPDLVIEADVTSESLNKFHLFSAVGVPEVWRYDDGLVTMYQLVNGNYVEVENSFAFPMLTSEMATQFLTESGEMRSTVWARHVRQWAREQLDAQQQPQG